jgi:hypothetical protein
VAWSDRGSMVELTVADRGPGIEPGAAQSGSIAIPNRCETDSYSTLRTPRQIVHGRFRVSVQFVRPKPICAS